MGKRERKLMLLDFLSDCQVALPPSLLMDNMRDRQFVPFSKRTARRMLRELEEDGLVEREPWEGGSYRITASGEAWLAAEKDD